VRRIFLSEPALVAAAAPSITEALGPSFFGRCFELLHRYSLGVFALLFLAVASSGIEVGAAYWSAHVSGHAVATTSSAHILAQPLRGPNTVVAADQLVSSLQHITTQPLNLIIGDKTVPIAADTIRSWLQVVSDKSKHVAYIHINAASVSASLTKITAAYAQAPVNQVTSTYADGSSSVIVAGRNGVSVGDTTQLASQLSSTVLSGKGLQLNVPLQSVPFQAITPAAFPKLLEVNVTTKQMWAYENGQLVRSFLVSAGKPSTPTPLGEFHIYEKLPVQDMTGFNPDGTKYFQPHVQWINYFDGGDAVHAVYWHPLSWFGVNNSSHGCVGVSTSDGEWVYDWAPIDTTVITHA
jgi:lipoprotein-anchoring transpeptidase ErfK/SrfK